MNTLRFTDSYFKMEEIDLHPSWISNCLLTWIFPVISYYKANKPSIYNMLRVVHQVDYERYRTRFKRSFNAQAKQGSPSFAKAFIRTFYQKILYIITVSFLSLGLMLADCLLIYYVILFVKDEDNSGSKGIYLATGIIAESLISIVLISHSLLESAQFVIKVKRIFIYIISKKCLRMHAAELSKESTREKCLKIITSDIKVLEGMVYVFAFCAISLAYICSIPIVIIFFGVWGLIGIMMSSLHIPLLLLIGNLAEQKKKSQSQRVTGEKDKLIENLIDGIIFLKLCVWEIPFLKLIFDEKAKESMLHKELMNNKVALLVLSYAGLALVIFVSVSLQAVSDIDLVTSEVFLFIAIMILSQILCLLIGVLGIKALTQILSFFSQIESLILKKEHKNVSKRKSSGSCENPAICMKNANLFWREATNNNDQELSVDESILSRVSFEIENKGLVVVVGPSNSGKTTLVLGILEEVFVQAEYLRISGSIAYAAEEPWLLAVSIKKNITMGLDYEKSWYKKVLKWCELPQELKAFYNSDDSVIGDVRVSLTESQKARIGLARALYSKSQILVLDEVFHSIEPEIASRLFQKIQKLSEHMIVILTTHKLNYLPQADYIIVLDKKSQTFAGTYKELNDRSDSQLMLSSIKLSYIESEASSKEKRLKKVKTIIYTGFEDRIDTKVSTRTYSQYTFPDLRSKVLATVMLILMLPSQFALIFALYWCTCWIDDDDPDTGYYITGLGIIVAACYALFMLRLYPFSIYLNSTNTNLHNNALKGLSRTKSTFFDKHSPSNLATSLSNDAYATENNIAYSYLETVSWVVYLGGILISVSIFLPYSLLYLPIFSILLYSLLSYFSVILVQLKRVVRITKGEFLSSYNSIIYGYTTIRPSGFYQYCLNEIEYRNLRIYKAEYAFQISSYLYQFCLLLLVNTLFIANAVIIILSKDSIDASIVGFLLVLSSMYVKCTLVLNTHLVQLQPEMGSVQRMLEFSQLESEDDESGHPGFEINIGSVRFVNLSLKYRFDSPLVLDSLNLYIESGSKFGIIGRAGAGKSSIVKTLFRLVTPDSGVILIDGKNHMRIKISELRRQLSIIPQSTSLFSTSIRNNLDPFQEHSDQEILQVLEQVSLTTGIEDSTWLQTVVGKDLDFSEGDKILVSVARALLRNNKILVVDEPKNIDRSTYEVMQAVLEKRFKECTRIIVARKLRSAMDCSSVIVVHAGTCKESGRPIDLYNDRNSMFRHLVLNSGRKETKELISMLRKSAEN